MGWHQRRLSPEYFQGRASGVFTRAVHPLSAEYQELRMGAFYSSNLYWVGRYTYYDLIYLGI